MNFGQRVGQLREDLKKAIGAVTDQFYEETGVAVKDVRPSMIIHFPVGDPNKSVVVSVDVTLAVMGAQFEGDKNGR